MNKKNILKPYTYENIIAQLIVVAIAMPVYIGIMTHLEARETKKFWSKTEPAN